jgi:hypothetical protein
VNAVALPARQTHGFRGFSIETGIWRLSNTRISVTEKGVDEEEAPAWEAEYCRCSSGKGKTVTGNGINVSFEWLFFYGVGVAQAMRCQFATGR